jgi:hypothetical protein
LCGKKTDPRPVRAMRTIIFLLLLVSPAVYAQKMEPFNPAMVRVRDIPLPVGFTRAAVVPGSFAAFLRELSLRRNNTVYLYNGYPKRVQSLHYAVIDLSTGNRDLQQCADVIMRLRAEYFYAEKKYDSIAFFNTAITMYRFSDVVKKNGNASREIFMRFMEKVFANCGTYSLEKQLKPVGIELMKLGDVFIKGGAPGHAEIVVDMAVNTATGQKLFMLAEGYMPAQDAHIVLNTSEPGLGPWYRFPKGNTVETPTWIFTRSQLKKW